MQVPIHTSKSVTRGGSSLNKQRPPRSRRLQLAAGLNHAGRHGAVHARGGLVLNRLDDVHAVHDLAEHHVAVVLRYSAAQYALRCGTECMYLECMDGACMPLSPMLGKRHDSFNITARPG